LDLYGKVLMDSLSSWMIEWIQFRSPEGQERRVQPGAGHPTAKPTPESRHAGRVQPPRLIAWSINYEEMTWRELGDPNHDG
jgi:hypothetical protein